MIDIEFRNQYGEGPCNVFILDTSSSLGEHGFTQMKEAFLSIIDGDFTYLFIILFAWSFIIVTQEIFLFKFHEVNVVIQRKLFSLQLLSILNVVECMA